MITKEIVVNDTTFKVTLTDQVISQVDNLRSLYATVSDDPENFEQVSSQISSVINDIATAVQPEVSDSYLDGVIQEVFKAVEDKKTELDKQIKEKASRCMPAFNKGGYQYVQDVKTILNYKGKRK